MYDLICTYCGKPFQAHFKDVKICDECKNRPCEVCGKNFVHEWPYDQRVCSKECRGILRKDPKNVAQREAKRKKTVQDRYGVDNVAKLQSSRDKIKEAKKIQYQERKIQREAFEFAERQRKKEAKEKLKREKEEEQKLAKLKPCKECGELFLPTPSNRQYCHKNHYRKCKVCGSSYIVKRLDLPYHRNVCYNSRCAAEWRKMRNVELYGTENSGNLPQFAEKRKKTNMERWGVDNPAKTDEIKNKIAEINIQKYGFYSTVKSPEERDQILSKSKEDWNRNLSELIKRRSQTCLKKYGVSNPRKLEEVDAKIRATNLERYGAEHPLPENFTSQISQRKAMLGRISGLNRAFKESLDKVGWDADFEFNIENCWYDLYMKGHPIIVEIDPTYTHFSECPPLFGDMPPHDKMNHLNRSLLASKYGFHCVHVFDWDDKFKVIQMLRRDREVVYARKCKVVEIDNQTATDFENAYHLQGAVRGQVVSLGLDIDGKLVEVMTFGIPRYNKNYQWELLRLCTDSDYDVIGGASKLFKYFVRNYDPDSVLSYCDRSKFSGEVYEKIGMTLHHTTDPAKVWSKGSEKITDNLLRQRGYDQLFNANYGKGTSNEELMIENGWRSVYDCGQAVYIYQREKN